ncbi:MAG: hypothetical protein AAFR96_05755 [Planctomycetota bacterium]
MRSSSLQLVGLTVMLAVAVLLVGCGEAHRSGDSGAQTDDLPRIVSLSPAASVMLRDAGLGDRIVGRHGWDSVLDPELPVAGDQTGIDYERLIGLRPTHVVIEWGARDLPARLRETARERSIELVEIDTLTLDDIASSAERVVSAFEDASPIDTGALVRMRDPKPAWGSVLLVVAATPTVDCLGPGSAHHELLIAGGFTPAIASGAPWVTMSVEDAITLDPACIVVVQPREQAALDENTLDEDTLDEDAAPADLAIAAIGSLARTDIRAIALGRVVLIDDPLGLIPSTNMSSFADELWVALDALGPLPSPRHD